MFGNTNSRLKKLEKEVLDCTYESYAYFNPASGNQSIYDAVRYILPIKVDQLDHLINGVTKYNAKNDPEHHKGLVSKVLDLESENKKLKAIVAELCDYVYADKGPSK
jgi:hypothetical protein